jgi:dGTPase
MDIADDIAYSTYDFEDAMKAGFATLLDVLI